MTTKRKTPRSPKIGCVQHDCAKCKKIERALKLTTELLDAIDLAEEDIGGARPIKDILGELGPAIDRVNGRR